MFTKLKWEIRIVLLIILGIIAFFIYGKVRQVQSIDFVEAEATATVEANQTSKEILEVLKDIEAELAKSNCIAVAQGDEEKLGLCN